VLMMARWPPCRELSFVRETKSTRPALESKRTIRIARRRPKLPTEKLIHLRANDHALEQETPGRALDNGEHP